MWSVPVLLGPPDPVSCNISAHHCSTLRAGNSQVELLVAVPKSFSTSIYGPAELWRWPTVYTFNGVIRPIESCPDCVYSLVPMPVYTTIQPPWYEARLYGNWMEVACLCPSGCTGLQIERSKIPVPLSTDIFSYSGCTWPSLAWMLLEFPYWVR